MPLLSTRGAASIKGFGLTNGGSVIADGFASLISNSFGYGVEFANITFDQNGNGYLSGTRTSSHFNGYNTLIKLEAGTGLKLWSKTFDTSETFTGGSKPVAYSNNKIYWYDGGGKILVFNTSGTYLSSYSLTGIGNDSQQRAQQLQFDSSGKAYFATTGSVPGYNTLSVIFFDSSFSVIKRRQYYLPITLQYNYFNFKVNPQGTRISFSFYNSSGAAYSPYAAMVATDDSFGRAIYQPSVGQYFTSCYPYGNILYASTYRSTFPAGLYVTAWDMSSNTSVWSKIITGISVDAHDTTADAFGNVYITYAQGVLKLNSAGSLLWAKNISLASASFINSQISNDSNLLFTAWGPFSNYAALSMAIPSVTGPANGTYSNLSGPLVISTSSPTVSNASYSWDAGGTLSIDTTSTASVTTTTNTVSDIYIPVQNQKVIPQ